MKFKEFLNESEYKKNVELEDALHLIKTRCSNMQFDKPYWRGMRGDRDSYIIDGSLGRRTSRDTSNYYNILIDEFSDSRYPKRLSSLICTNYYGKEYAERWSNYHAGSLYAVFPYNDAKIGYIGGEDIWGVNCKIGKYEANLERWNATFDEYGLSDKSYNDFIKSIKDKFEDNKTLADIFENDKSNIEEFIKKAYSTDELKFISGQSKEINSYNKKSEIWIAGNCILLKEDQWEKIVKFN